MWFFFFFAKVNTGRGEFKRHIHQNFIIGLFFLNPFLRTSCSQPVDDHGLHLPSVWQELPEAQATKGSQPDSFYWETCGLQLLWKVIFSPIQPSSHHMTHTREELLPCTICDKFFCNSSSLQMHKRTHLGDTLYSCSKCTKAFSHTRDLNTHMRIDTREKPYSCPQYDKVFCQAQHLKTHKMTHSGEKSYSCSDCTKLFSRPYSLMMHMRVRTGEKPYSCLQCGKAVSTHGALKSHQKTHSVPSVKNHSLHQEIWQLIWDHTPERNLTPVASVTRPFLSLGT